MTTVVIFFAAFILLSGLMAAVDAALLSVTTPEIEELIHDGKTGAVRLRTVKQHLTRAVVVIVILTNTINVLGPILVSREAFARFGPESLGIVTAVLTLGTILFSEIIPKAIGTHYAPLIGRMAAAPLMGIGLVLTPLVLPLAWLSRLFTRGTRPIGTERQIRSLALLGRRAGHIESDEIQMIYRAFLLNDRMARDIMTPRDDIIAIPADSTVRQAADIVCRNRFSRYPVYRDSLDRVEGLVTGRDILEALAGKHDDDPITTIAHRALTVDAETASDELLVVFRDEHIHLAVVRDGKQTVGVVTLENVLEELVGEIEDETDADPRFRALRSKPADGRDSARESSSG